VLETLSNQKKSDWKSLATSSQTCSILWCTELSGVHRSVSGAQVGAPGELAALGKSKRSSALIHRTVRCGSCAHSNGRPHDQWATRGLRQQSQGHTKLSGVPRGRWLQRLASPEKEGNHTLFTVRWCTGLSGAPTDRRQL
jgi:hypothetical protein